MSRISQTLDPFLSSSFSGYDFLLDLGTGDGKHIMDYQAFRDIPKKMGVEVCKYKETFHDSSWEIVTTLKEALSKLPSSGKILVTMLDFIEHLPKEEGVQLLKELEEKATSIFMYTPRGFLEQSVRTHPKLIKSNSAQNHVSGWTEVDFNYLGYTYRIFPDFLDPEGHSHKWDSIAAWKTLEVKI